jgi:hypothetical protein
VLVPNKATLPLTLVPITVTYPKSRSQRDAFREGDVPSLDIRKAKGYQGFTKPWKGLAFADFCGNSPNWTQFEASPKEGQTTPSLLGRLCRTGRRFGHVTCRYAWAAALVVIIVTICSVPSDVLADFQRNEYQIAKISVPLNFENIGIGDRSPHVKPLFACGVISEFSPRQLAANYGAVVFIFSRSYRRPTSGRKVFGSYKSKVKIRRYGQRNEINFGEDCDTASWRLSNVDYIWSQLEFAIISSTLPETLSGLNNQIGAQLSARSALLISTAQDQSERNDSQQYGGESRDQRIVPISESFSTTDERETDDDSGLYFILAVITAWVVGGLTYAVLKGR